MKSRGREIVKTQEKMLTSTIAYYPLRDAQPSPQKRLAPPSVFILSKHFMLWNVPLTSTGQFS